MKAAASPGPSAFLRGQKLLAGLGEDALRDFEGCMRLKRLEKGDYLFLQSGAADAFYLVYTGVVSMVLFSEDGRELVINEMRPGDCFGELALLTGQARSTAAVARVDSEVWAMPGESFRRLLETHPRLARNLLETVARRLQNSSERESALAFLDAQARLARLLLELDEKEAEKGYVTISQEELAQRTGLIRQTVAKALGRWRRAGWLITGRGRIMLLNHAELRRLETRLKEGAG